MLVLGGGWFLGRAVVEVALGAGDQVTVFNRGLSPSPRGDVECLRGDRADDKDLARLAEHGPWDAVVDVHGVVPRQVGAAAAALREVASRYAFVSSVSAYQRWPAEPVTEESPLHPADPDADPGEWEWGTGVYGPLKAGVGAAARQRFGVERLLVLRPGVRLGPGEYGGRLTWWLRRAARGGHILGAGAAQDAIRPIDVRDGAAFLVGLLHARVTGTLNVAGPDGRDTIGDLIDGCLRVARGDGVVTWVDSSWLGEQGVRQWVEMPLWRTLPGTWAIDRTRAAAAGLVCRPLDDTVADT